MLAEELAQCPDDWKDYYQILRISPNADNNTITEAYHSLYHTLNVTLSDYTQETPYYAELLTDVNEAHKVLSDSATRTTYDRVFWLKYNSARVYIEEPVKYELVDIAQSITTRLSESLKGINWETIPLLSKITRPVVLGVSGAVVVVLFSGTSFAFANPEHPMAVPFKGMAITLTQATAGSVSLIAGVRETIAALELHIVSTSLQSMRMENGLKENPAITVSTNDMAHFPSPEHPLFPDYLDRRFSQFKYTVNSKGIISVDTSWAITDDLLDRIMQTIERLENNQ